MDRMAYVVDYLTPDRESNLNGMAENAARRGNNQRTNGLLPVLLFG